MAALPQLLLRVYNEHETQRKDELMTKTTLPPS